MTDAQEEGGMEIMNQRTQHKKLSPRGWRPGWGILALILGVVLTGCDDLLDVHLPGIVEAEQALSDPANAPVMVNGALGEFECAYPQYIISTGIIAHEFRVSGIIGVWQNWGALRDVARNDEGACTTTRTATNVGFFNPVSRARVMAEDGYERITGFAAADVPDRENHLAKLAAYSGYSHLLLGEGMCEITLDGGPAMTPAEVQSLAEARFGDAMQHAQASGNTSILNMARVGRARLRLNQGNAAGAVADAEAVPQGFVRYANYSTVTPRRENNIHNSSFFQFHMSVHPDYWDLEVNGTPDPRVSLQDMQSLGVDNLTEQVAPLKYGERSSPIRIASWEEAQLIIAEAEGGQRAVDIINMLRDQHGLPPFQSSDPAEIQAQILEERRRELFLEGHRLNDMLRHGLPFPTGTNHKGAPYGSLTCVPLSDQERSANPNL
jgi:starch-binding outer membrane protein, SusD/RagB family